jgi:hypothetical protein
MIRNVYPVSSIYLKIFLIYLFTICQAGTNVFWWSSIGECQYAVVESFSHLSDVRFKFTTHPESY